MYNVGHCGVTLQHGLFAGTACGKHHECSVNSTWVPITGWSGDDEESCLRRGIKEAEDAFRTVSRREYILSLKRNVGGD